MTCWRVATRPVVASHTGVRGVADNARNLTDEQLRGHRGDRRHGRDRLLADGLAAARTRRRSPARSPTPSSVVGADHVGLGSDFDGAVPTPFDASGMALLTAALLARGPRRGDDRGRHGRLRDPAPARGAAAGLSEALC